MAKFASFTPRRIVPGPWCPSVKSSYYLDTDALTMIPTYRIGEMKKIDGLLHVTYSPELYHPSKTVILVPRPDSPLTPPRGEEVWHLGHEYIPEGQLGEKPNAAK